MNKAKKRIIKAVSLIVAFLIIQSTFSWALKPINYARWVNNDIKTYKNEVDTVILGSSRVFCGFDPETFDKETGCVSFNLGSASQGIKDSYYYLMNCQRKFADIKNVFIDIYFVSLIKKEKSAGENLQRKIILLDRLNDPLTKIQYIFNSFEIDELPMAFFNTLYFKKDRDSIIGNVKAKLEPDYINLNPQCRSLLTPYKYRGYIPYPCSEKGDLSFPKETELNYNIDDEAVKYLNKIISFCKDKNINLFFVQMPISAISNSEVAEYRDFFNKEIAKISEENAIPYVDLNNNDKYVFSDDEHFTSPEHLNIKGAELATKYCTDFYKSNVK